MNKKSGFWIALWVVLVVLTGFLAFGSGGGYRGYGPSSGWGPMGNWFEGNRGDGAAAWYGPGSGMIGRANYGQGWGGGRSFGMMGAYGAGVPGMGYGMGAGGVGAGMGFGMAGGGYAMMPWALPDLTPEQVQKIGQLQNDPDGRMRSFMQQRWEVQASLSRLYAAEKPDWSAIRKANMDLLELQRQQLDVTLDQQQKMDALLTDSQRTEMARARRSVGFGWMGGQ